MMPSSNRGLYYTDKEEMAMIPVTDRELFHGYRQNFSVYNSVTVKTNAHRLLLFYAVECGLKVLILGFNQVNHTKNCPDFASYGHDLDKLLDILEGGQNYKINKTLQMDNLTTSSSETLQRNFKIHQLNQVWRYGGSVTKSSLKDEDLEQKLLAIYHWIHPQIQSIFF